MVQLAGYSELGVPDNDGELPGGMDAVEGRIDKRATPPGGKCDIQGGMDAVARYDNRTQGRNKRIGR